MRASRSAAFRAWARVTGAALWRRHLGSEATHVLHRHQARRVVDGSRATRPGSRSRICRRLLDEAPLGGVQPIAKEVLAEEVRELPIGSPRPCVDVVACKPPEMAYAASMSNSRTVITAPIRSALRRIVSTPTAPPRSAVTVAQLAVILEDRTRIARIAPGADAPSALIDGPLLQQLLDERLPRGSDTLEIEIEDEDPRIDGQVASEQALLKRLAHRLEAVLGERDRRSKTALIRADHEQLVIGLKRTDEPRRHFRNRKLTQVLDDFQRRSRSDGAEDCRSPSQRSPRPPLPQPRLAPDARGPSRRGGSCRGRHHRSGRSSAGPSSQAPPRGNRAPACRRLTWWAGRRTPGYRLLNSASNGR